MSRSNYKDAYISRDTNGAFGADFGDARFFAASTAEKPLLSLDGGITMDAHAFRDDIPTLSHTPEELGMKIEGTPFAAQKPPIGVNKPDSMKADPPVGGFPITHDANSYPINDRAAFAADGVLNTMNTKIMTGVKQYWGIGLVIASLVGAGYYLGRKK
jgi:hypothetical protein|tara:strand:+ start:182 stop:655 length:474 start_codon:yes stop_codon:yes gene_type:complete